MKKRKRKKGTIATAGTWATWYNDPNETNSKKSERTKANFPKRKSFWGRRRRGRIVVLTSGDECDGDSCKRRKQRRSRNESINVLSIDGSASFHHPLTDRSVSEYWYENETLCCQNENILESWKGFSSILFSSPSAASASAFTFALASLLLPLLFLFLYSSYRTKSLRRWWASTLDRFRE